MRPAHIPDGLHVRLLLPSSRHALREWEIAIDGQVVGHVREQHYRGIIFFEAVGVHNVTGEEVSLQVSTDFAQRVEVVRAFWVDPMSARQHLPWGLRRFHGLI